MRKIITICTLFALMSTFVSCGGSSSPGDAAVEHATYMQNGEYEEFVNALYISPEEMEDAESVEKENAQLVAMLEMKGGEALKAKDGIKDIVLVSETISEDGKTAVAVINIIYGNGEEDENPVNLILNDDGVWKSKLSK